MATIAGTAYAQLAVTPNPAATNMGTIPENSPGRVVFSIRNTSTGSIDITGFSNQGGAGCANITISPSTATLAPNQQQQFVATTTGFAAGTNVCTWDIATSPTSSASVTTSFSTATVASPADVQPSAMDFGSQFIGNTETQDVTVTSNLAGGSGYAMISNDPSNKFRFDEGMCGTGNFHNCMLSIPSYGNTLTLPVTCDPMMVTGTPAFVAVYSTGGLGSGSGSGSQLLGQVPLQDCIGGNAIQIENAPISIITQPSTVGSGSAHIISLSGMGNLDFAMLSTGDPSFKITDCNAQSCSPGTALPTYLTIECVGTSTPTSAQLMVYGSGVGSDVGTITCVAMGSTGNLDATPKPLDFNQQDVGTNTSLPLTLFNSGGSPVSGVIVSPPGNTTDWSVTGCSSVSPCTIGAGSNQDVTVTFHPTTYGPLDTSVMISASGPIIPFSVQLLGDGLAGDMQITQPSGPPFVLDFGTIPRGQPFTRTLTVTNVGNKTFTANAITPTSPYSITPMASELVTPGALQNYTVTCESQTASLANDQTLAVTSNALFNSSANVSLKCAIADTAVQVSPQQFDFGEVRTGSPQRELTVTVTNPAGAAAAAHVTSMQLREPRTGLSLQPAMTDRMLQPGESVSATLVLTTAVDSDLEGELLDITVDAAMLSLPVTGKVVTAASSIVPPAIDLGTACVGSTVMGDVTLSNDGTATLQVDRPEMDTSFVASVPGSMMFPTALQPGMPLMATVEPVVTTAGAVSGTLTWDDDVPSHYQVPVKLEYISSGTAISPALIDFGSISVDAAGFPKHVNIENCDLTPTEVTIKAIRTQNSPVGAWVLEPRLGYKKVLAAGEKQAITVTFRPPARGRYEADLEVETSIGPKTIHLRGDAVGRDFDNTSFYACECTSLSPSRGWPILAAILFIIFRRRRGSSSAR